MPIRVTAPTMALLRHAAAATNGLGVLPSGGRGHGEYELATYIGGQVAPRKRNSSDVRGPTGLTIEVKYSGLIEPVARRPTRRWRWNNLLGTSGKKQYDYLALLAEPDPRFLERYRNRNNTEFPYVVFLLPYRDVTLLFRERNIKGGALTATTDPFSISKSCAFSLQEYGAIKTLLFRFLEVSGNDLQDVLSGRRSFEDVKGRYPWTYAQYIQQRTAHDPLTRTCMTRKRAP